jgi:DNA helicase-2/ATP-dependent DNA helicase PcrA
MSSLGIKENIARKILDFAEMIRSFMQKITADNAFDFASNVVKRSGIYADLKANKTPEGVSRLENIEELLNGIQEYATNSEEEFTTITEYLQNVSLITNDDTESPDDRNRISLMTVHSSKGLEFDHVYIVGVEEGLFPGALSAQSEHDLEEERRLFYVALTRAAVKVNISCARSRFRYGNLTSSPPSRFIRDIDRMYLATTVNENINENELRKKPIFQRKDDFRNLQAIKNEPAAQSNTVAEISGIRVGNEVEHERFGSGTVTEIEGYGNDVKIKIDFRNSGKKTLLMKYAKLTVKS